MPEPTPDKHYEEKFEFPLWKLNKQHAQEKDISYSSAYKEVLPEYKKTIRYYAISYVHPVTGKWNYYNTRSKKRKPILKRII